MTAYLLAGVGVANAAVAEALLRRGHEVLLADDRGGPVARAVAEQHGLALHVAPDWEALVSRADLIVPTPGLPETHAALSAAVRRGIPFCSEFDLASEWDGRPTAMVTATNGKTTVTTLIADMLHCSGRTAAAVGNTDVPWVAALDDAAIDVFVVEASSFRLGWSTGVRPDVGVWLNFAPDHLDVHADLDSYRRAKARIWENVRPGATSAVAVWDDVVVREEAARLDPSCVVWVTASDVGEARRSLGAGVRVAGRRGSEIVLPDDTVVAAIDKLWSRLPHDVSNVAAAASAATAVGATIEGVRAAVDRFRGLRHRVEFVAELGGVRWYDDSKSTTPHSTAAAVAGFESVVLLAGGRNKGLDLSMLGRLAAVRELVGFGESRHELERAIAGGHWVETLDEAVRLAAELAHPGDAVLLSPACASFDQYSGYDERGDHFRELVSRLSAGGGVPGEVRPDEVRPDEVRPDEGRPR